MAFDALKLTKTLLNVDIPPEQATKKNIALAVAELKADFRVELSGIKAELNFNKWMLGALLALATANFAKQYF